MAYTFAKITHTITKFRLEWQCDFVVFTNMGIYMVKIEFKKGFWKSTINSVKLFCTERVITTWNKYWPS